MDANKLLSDSSSISGDELREQLKRPADPTRKERFLKAIAGSMSEAEADAFERRVNEMRAWANGDTNQEKV